MIDLTHFSCFTGIAGIDIAAEWAGIRTVGQVELADWPFRHRTTGMAGRAKMEGH